MDKEIYIIRHGETDYNKKNIVQGRGINSSLNKTGLEQSLKFYNKYRNSNFHKIYVSSLQRTHQTVHNFIQDGIPVIKSPLIDEINWGKYEGVAHDPATHDEYLSIIEQWSKGNLSLKIDGGESAADLSARIEPFVEMIKMDQSQRILICTHGRTLRAMLCILNGVCVSKMDTFSHSNTTLYRLNYLKGKFYLIESNSTTHLND